MSLVEEILANNKMKSSLDLLTQDEIDDLKIWLDKYLLPVEMARLKMREAMSTEDGVDQIAEAVEYIFSKEGSEKCQEKN